MAARASIKSGVPRPGVRPSAGHNPPDQESRVHWGSPRESNIGGNDHEYAARSQHAEEVIDHGSWIWNQEEDRGGTNGIDGPVRKEKWPTTLYDAECDAVEGRPAAGLVQHGGADVHTGALCRRILVDDEFKHAAGTGAEVEEAAPSRQRCQVREPGCQEC